MNLKIDFLFLDNKNIYHFDFYGTIGIEVQV